MKIAVFRLIECISIANLPLEQVHILKYTEIIEESLKSFVEGIQIAASKAFAELSRVYHTELKKEYKVFVDKMIKSASTDANAAITRGYTKGLTSLNKFMTSHYLPEIIRICSENCKIKPKGLDDADTRKYTVNGIWRIIQTVGLEDNIITQEMFDKLFNLLFDVMNDYTMDNRGDIGSLIRQESMSSQLKILRIYSQAKKQNKNIVVIKEQTMQKMIQLLLQQLAEKIDRIRLVAGSVLQEIFEQFIQYLPDFAHKDKFIHVFNKENIKQMVAKDQQKMDSAFETQVVVAELAYLVTQDIKQDSDDFIYYWNQPEGAFQIIVPLLDLEEYSLHLLKGISISIGGLTESVIKYSSQSMSEYLVTVNKNPNRDIIYSRIFENSITLLTENKKDERVIVPLYKTLDFIIEKQEIQKWVILGENKKYIKTMYELIIKEIHLTKQILKLTSVVGLLVTLTQLEYKEMQNDFFLLIGKLLCHVFPKVRKQMADKFYMMLLGNGEDIFGAEKSDDMIDFIMSQDWLDERLNLVQMKEKFYKLLDVQDKTDVQEIKKDKKEDTKKAQIEIDDDEI